MTGRRKEGLWLVPLSLTPPGTQSARSCRHSPQRWAGHVARGRRRLASPEAGKCAGGAPGGESRAPRASLPCFPQQARAPRDGASRSRAHNRRTRNRHCGPTGQRARRPAAPQAPRPCRRAAERGGARHPQGRAGAKSRPGLAVADERPLRPNARGKKRPCPAHAKGFPGASRRSRTPRHGQSAR